MNAAQKSGMRGDEKHEAPPARPGDPSGSMEGHIHKDAQTGDHYLNLSSITDAMERQTSGPHDDRAKEFSKPNADKFEEGATKDTAKEAKGNERS
jgi:hypothetical protein